MTPPTEQARADIQCNIPSNHVTRFTHLTSLLLAAMLSLAHAAQPTIATTNAPTSRARLWKQDLRFLARELPARHVDFYKIIPKKEFQGKIRKLETELNKLSDVEITFRLMQLVARLGISHTWIGFPDTPAFHGYPVMFRWFPSELGVEFAAPGFNQLIGARVLQIGSLTPEQAVAAVAPYISYENDAWLYRQSPLLLRNSELLRLLNIAEPDGRLRLSLVLTNDTPLSLELQPLASGEPQWLSVETLNVPSVRWRNRTLSYSYEFFREHQALYIEYNHCGNIPSCPFAKFVQEVFAFAASNAVRRIIVDLRSNGGGDSTVMQPLVAALQSRPHLCGKDHLFVLVGGGTFSSGVFAAVDLKDKLGATLVGEPSGGKPNGYGNTPCFHLPNSRMQVWYCTSYFTLVKDADPPSLAPDIPVPIGLQDFRTGRDPVLDVALRAASK